MKGLREEVNVRPIMAADALVIGTPVYYGAESASTRAFMERLLYPYNNYSKDSIPLFPRRINTAMIYTMNIPEEMIESMGYDRMFNHAKMLMGRHFGACELLLSTDALQFDDYDNYASGIFDKVAKAKRHADVFPEDCRRAFELGVRMASGDIPEPMPRFEQ
jgi:multimeric flavodoxin WrbA